MSVTAVSVIFLCFGSSVSRIVECVYCIFEIVFVARVYLCILYIVLGCVWVSLLAAGCSVRLCDREPRELRGRGRDARDFLVL